MSVFEKLSVPSLKEAFVQTMLEKIISGELKPGDKLPAERDLASQMGISRTSVNHGILELESMGFVKINPRHGTTVVDYMKYQTPQTLSAVMNYGSIELNHPLFHDLMETRVLLEREGASLACTNAYEKTLQKMQDDINSITGSQEKVTDAIYLFHYHMMQASGNSVYAMIFRGFESTIKVLIKRHYELKSEDTASATREHQMLLDSIKAKHRKQAAILAEQIIRKGETVLEEKYQASSAGTL